MFCHVFCPTKKLITRASFTAMGGIRNWEVVIQKNWGNLKSAPLSVPRILDKDSSTVCNQNIVESHGVCVCVNESLCMYVQDKRKVVNKISKCMKERRALTKIRRTVSVKIVVQDSKRGNVWAG